MTHRQDLDRPRLDDRPPLLERASCWVLERAWSLTLLSLFLLALGLLSSCVSPETASRLEVAEERVEELQADPTTTDDELVDALLELAEAKGLYADELADEEALDRALGGGLWGLLGAAGVWLLRQRSRRRLEARVGDLEVATSRALHDAEAAKVAVASAKLEG